MSTHICLALRACLRFASLRRSHMVIRVSLAFIFQTFVEVCYSVFVKHSSLKTLLDLCKAYIFQEFAEDLLSIGVC